MAATKLRPPPHRRREKQQPRHQRVGGLGRLELGRDRWICSWSKAVKQDGFVSAGETLMLQFKTGPAPGTGFKLSYKQESKGGQWSELSARSSSAILSSVSRLQVPGHSRRKASALGHGQDEGRAEISQLPQSLLRYSNPLFSWKK